MASQPSPRRYPTPRNKALIAGRKLRETNGFHGPTVDGRNPAPPWIYTTNLNWLAGFCPSTVSLTQHDVMDFFAFISTVFSNAVFGRSGSQVDALTRCIGTYRFAGTRRHLGDVDGMDRMDPLDWPDSSVLGGHQPFQPPNGAPKRWVVFFWWVKFWGLKFQTLEDSGGYDGILPVLFFGGDTKNT